MLIFCVKRFPKSTDSVNKAAGVFCSVKKYGFDIGADFSGQNVLIRLEVKNHCVFI